MIMDISMEVYKPPRAWDLQDNTDMRLSLGLVVAAAVCLEIAQGLSCFTCDSMTTSSECNQRTNCSALSSKLVFCRTNIMSPEVGFPFTGREQVLRQCAEKCDPTGLNWLGVTRKVLCCNLDFCNLNGIQDGSSSGSGTATDNCSHNTGAKATINLITTIVLVFSAVAYSVNGQN